MELFLCGRDDDCAGMTFVRLALYGISRSHTYFSSVVASIKPSMPILLVVIGGAYSRTFMRQVPLCVEYCCGTIVSTFLRRTSCIANGTAGLFWYKNVWRVYLPNPQNFTECTYERNMSDGSAKIAVVVSWIGGTGI